MLCLDLVFKVCTFLSWKDVYALRITCKEYEKYTKHSGIWRVLGKRDFDRDTQSEYEYFLCIPELVKEWELDTKMSEKWCQPYLAITRLNSNSKPDHIPKAYIRSICINLLREGKVRKFYELFWKTETADWRIGVNRLIEFYVTQSEDDKRQLDLYVKNFLS